jgi:hypothetical protein
MLCAVIVVAAVYEIILARLFTDAAIKAQLVRVAPFAFWAAWSALLTLVILPLTAHENEPANVWRAFPWLPAGVALTGVAAVAVFVVLSRIGLTPDRAGWDSIGTPLLTSQVWLVWLLAIVVTAILSKLGQRRDLLAFVAIWGIAILVWWGTPLGPTFFSPRPVAPNYEYYPHSDAALLALNSESLLMGNGFQFPPEKPLYNLFLSSFLLLGGHDYQTAVNIQIVVLALLPAVIYLIGARMDLRLGGLIAAGLVILRESNSIDLSGVIAVSHSKLMMTDFPGALGTGLIVFVFFSWLRDPDALKWPVLSGGTLGLFLLVRSQAILLVPVVLLGVLVIFWGYWQRIGIFIGLFIVTLFLAILPWMLRNLQATGVFGYSQPYQERYISGQYSFTPELPRTTEQEEAGFSHVVSFTRENPGYVAGFFLTHLLRNELSSLMALPVEFHLPRDFVEYYGLLPYWQEQGTERGLWEFCCGLDNYIDRQGYWSALDIWQGDFRPQSRMPLIANLFVIALGIGMAWRAVGWAGLTPLVVHLSYSASTAIARISGWRLILPVDWVMLLYYALGLATITLALWGYLMNRNLLPERVEAPWPERRSSYSLVWVMLAFLAAGASIPILEWAIPPRYQPISIQEVAAEYDLSAIDQMGASAITGRVLFPRHYGADEGLGGNDTPAFDPRPFSRLGFFLVGPNYSQVLLRVEQPPQYFPNAVDAIVVGCPMERYFQALVIILIEDEITMLFPDEALTCHP